MNSRVFPKLIKSLFGLFSVVSISLGVIILVTGYQNYEDPSLNTFPLTVVAVALILLPITILFIAKTVRSYRNLDEKYGLPDLPTRPLVLAGGSILLVAAIVVIIIIYFVMLHSPS